MQIRAAVAALATAFALASPARAQSDAMAGGLTSGNYLRVAGGLTVPVNPQGSLRNWGSGQGISANYENWSSGGNGVGRFGFGLMAAYSFLPLKEQSFTSEFVPSGGGTTTSATASRAKILEIASTLRFRIPAPVVMPAIVVGFGFINWAPGTIRYTASNGASGSVKQSHRSGAELSVGGSLDRQLWGPYAAYIEGSYTYGYTSYGRGFATPGGVCSTSGCDPLKNTTIAALRAGLRVRVGGE